MGPGPWAGRARAAKMGQIFENIKVQDRNSGHFGGIIIGFGAMATQLVPKLFLGKSTKEKPVI